MLPTESVRITPLGLFFSTAAASAGAGKLKYFGESDVDIYIAVKGGSDASGISATSANYFGFSITESTAASQAGSVITNATLDLGATAAFTAKGMIDCVLGVTTDCATTCGVTLNGIRYIGTAVGATALVGGAKLARAINGYGTSVKLPHYTACGSYLAKDQVLVYCDDGCGTGLEGACTAGSGIVVRMTHLAGVVHIPAGKLSTNQPKFLGITASTNATNTSIQSAFAVTYPGYRGGTPGRYTIVT